jgi:hypothetical protein
MIKYLIAFALSFFMLLLYFQDNIPAVLLGVVASGIVIIIGMLGEILNKMKK